MEKKEKKTMSEIILTGKKETKEGRDQFLTDFQKWKIETNNDFPSAKEAWDYQASRIAFQERLIDQATDTISNMKNIISDLKDFTEDNIKLISDLEMENLKLKGELDE